MSFAFPVNCPSAVGLALASQGQQIAAVALGNAHLLNFPALAFPLLADGGKGGVFPFLEALDVTANTA